MQFSRFALGAILAGATLAASAQTVERKGYIVELADAPAAAYEGTVSGLQATRPASGGKLNVNASHVQAYLSYLNGKAGSVASLIPSAPVYHRYGVAFNGFAAKLTAAELQKLLASPGVKAITADELSKPGTTYTPSFLGLTGPNGFWSKTDASGRALKGEDIIIAHVDTGVWPEDPSFSDKVDSTGKPVSSHLAGTVVYGPPPAKWTGTCQAGAGFTAAMCNNKLIGARYFNAGYKSVNGTNAWAFEYLDSPRDGDGHGSHTLSTAGGNENVSALVGGVNAVSGMSGIAPRARVAAYKACFTATGGPADTATGCYGSDTLAAVNQAVADGADVINYSIGGSRTSVRDALQTAFRNAAAAGVYVSTSAGNSNVNGAPTSAHSSPWVMTVGNSTHDRYTEAIVTLGSGATAQGASFQTTGLSTKPLVWSRNVGLAAAPAAQGSNQALCYGAADGVAALLDPAKVSGKIIVCDRGGNVLVNKVANAKAAGAVGVIIQNTPVSANTTPLISAVLPTVHLPLSAFAVVTTEASLPNGTAAFSPSFQVAGVVAPVMSASSSRGPSQADNNILKPDVTAPGTDIIAAYMNRDLTVAQHDAVAAGTLIPEPWAEMISGTSMSSPHSAGLGALLKQANPTWSPYAIKSAIMTSALQNVKLANGTVDANRWGFGAGHINPNAALATKVVFDQSNAEHLAYYNGSLTGSALNLASMTASSVIGVHTFTRRVTNKGSSPRTYSAGASVAGFTVAISPANFTIAPGVTQSFTVQLTRTTAAIGAYTFGEVVLAGDDGVNLRSPVTIRPQSFVGSTSVTDTRTVGTKVFTVATGYTGTFNVQASGMVAATRLNGNVGLNQEVCFPFSVPAGAKQVRAQTFDSETGGGAARDIDLVMLRGSTLVGSSGGTTSEELIVLNNPPAAADYQICVDGFNAPVAGASNFTVNLWVVPAVTVPATLKAFGPAQVTTGGTASVGVSWTVAAGNRHLGVVEYRQTPTSAVLGSTTVFIDASAAGSAPAQAPLLSSKPLN